MTNVEVKHKTQMQMCKKRTNLALVTLTQETFTCSKSTTEQIEKDVKYSCSGVFIVNFEQISRLFLELPLLPLNKQLLAGRMIL